MLLHNLKGIQKPKKHHLLDRADQILTYELRVPDAYLALIQLSNCCCTVNFSVGSNVTATLGFSISFGHKPKTQFQSKRLYPDDIFEKFTYVHYCTVLRSILQFHRHQLDHNLASNIVFTYFENGRLVDNLWLEFQIFLSCTKDKWYLHILFQKLFWSTVRKKILTYTKSKLNYPSNENLIANLNDFDKSAILTLNTDNRLRTPNEGINFKNLKIWGDMADKICFGRT